MYVRDDSARHKHPHSSFLRTLGTDLKMEFIKNSKAAYIFKKKI